jgi:hypothetical protein
VASKIAILNSQQIDDTLWNNCIANASNGLIYSTTFYLNNMCVQWKGLVLNNYEAVMALPYKKKLGLPYLYTPAFIQQLGLMGIFSTDDLSNVYTAIAKQFLYGDYFLNSFCSHWQNIVAKQNFILPLNKTFNTLLLQCNANFKSRFNKFYKQLQYVQSSNIEYVIANYKQIHGSKTPHVTPQDFDNLITICKQLQQVQQLHIRVVSNNQETVAAIVLLQYKNRLYNIANFTTANGKLLHANYFLFAQVIKEFCNQNLILDFEGSNIESIAHFYKKMNPQLETYFHWQRNFFANK